MIKKQKITIPIGVIVFVVIPIIVHSFFKGSYVIGPEYDRRSFWIDPVGTTLPYIILAVVFFIHSLKLKNKNVSSYAGAIMAWFSMMGFTYYLINQASGSDGSELSSTLGIAIVLTPFFYIFVLAVSYTIGSMIGIKIEKRKNKKTV